MNGEESEQAFADIVFRDEALTFTKKPETINLPEPLAKARAIDPPGYWSDRLATFLRQGRMLADYEDDYEYDGDPVRYYPTYQSLTDEELRGYFSWRAKIRKGQFIDASLSFIFLYIYELINNIGVKDAGEGYNQLLEVKRRFGQLDPKLDYYLERWLVDYVVYYNLDAQLLADSSQVVNDQCIAVLEEIENEPQDKVIDAIRQLAPKWLKRSRFYCGHFEDMDAVIYRVIRQMSAYYKKNCKRTFIEQYFGLLGATHIHIFSAAVFANPLKRRDYQFKVDSQCVYTCEDGIWSINKRSISRRGLRKLENLLKTIDSLMREMLGYSHPVKTELSTKWINSLIKNEIGSLLAEKAANAKKKLTIDYSKLDRIRSDAAQTRDKLIVEEEEAAIIPHEPESKPSSTPLEPVEYRFMHSLLYEEDTSWVKKEGYLLSVLVDGINEKLFDVFEDSVLDDSPQVIDDYAANLKEMIPQ